MEIEKLSLVDLRSLLLEKKVSSAEITKFFIKRAQDLNPRVNAYITFDESALQQAQEFDRLPEDKKRALKLGGIPFGIKDMLCTKNLRTTAASKMLENFIPPYDSTVVSRLKNQGAVILGKLNQDEFAMGSSNETSFFGATKNPWNLEYVPGGSSGGSAAAMAAKMAVATIGTDTGGSIRQPASFCGVVGVKPTYGRVSRYGIIAFASSLDQAGPMTQNVADSALVLETICGHDPKDATSSQRPVPEFSKHLNNKTKLRVGVLSEALKGGLDSDVEKALQGAIQDFKNQGAEICEVSLPLLDHAISVYYLIASSEASSNLSRYDGVRFGHRAKMDESSVSLDEFYARTRGEGFGPEVKRRIMMGTFCLSSGYIEAYYEKACRVRRLIQRDYENAFENCDVILSPVAASPAFKIGERISDPLQMYLNDIFTTSTNLAGLPGMSVPYSLSKTGLPIGLQLTAKAFDEQTLLNAAATIEDSSPFKRGDLHAAL
jgi:aspartyl-tRNA(Asn)/glutamyl-tRNA(Gln) amidotransferase subunit A